MTFTHDRFNNWVPDVHMKWVLSLQTLLPRTVARDFLHHFYIISCVKPHYFRSVFHSDNSFLTMYISVLKCTATLRRERERLWLARLV